MYRTGDDGILCGNERRERGKASRSEKVNRLAGSQHYYGTD
jgi:hypothetical protein